LKVKQVIFSQEKPVNPPPALPFIPMYTSYKTNSSFIVTSYGNSSHLKTLFLWGTDAIYV
jgi:hypothetical protein